MDRGQDRSLNASSSPKNISDPVGISLKRGASGARRQAINPTPPKRVKAWGDGPLRLVEINRLVRMLNSRLKSLCAKQRTRSDFSCVILVECGFALSPRRTTFQLIMRVGHFIGRILSTNTSCWEYKSTVSVWLQSNNSKLTLFKGCDLHILSLTNWIF